MHEPRKTSPKETKKKTISLKAIPWSFKCFQTFPKASRLLLTCGELPFWKPVLHGSSPMGAALFLLMFELRGDCVLLSGLPQLERQSPTMHNLLEFSLKPSAICSFLFSCKNNENCSITFFQMLHTAWWYLMLRFYSVICGAQPSLY